MGAIIPLLIAWSYVIMGLWLGARFLVAGLVVAAVTLGGYFYWPEHFCGLMAVVGGGTLIVTGLWLQEGVMDQPDPIIHQPVRLKIMAALKPLPPAEFIEFMRLKTIAAATEGNLGAHIGTLEQAGYVEVEKDFVGQAPAHPRAPDQGRPQVRSKTMSPICATSWTPNPHPLRAEHHEHGRRIDLRLGSHHRLHDGTHHHKILACRPAPGGTGIVKAA